VEVGAWLREELVRVTREAVTNATRHSGSNIVHVRLTVDDELRLEIRDEAEAADREGDQPRVELLEHVVLGAEDRAGEPFAARVDRPAGPEARLWLFGTARLAVQNVERGRVRQQRLTDRLGASIQGDYRRTHRIEDRLHLQWLQEDFGGTPRYQIERFDPSYKDIDKHRFGFNAQLDYTLGDDAWVYFRAMGSADRQNKATFTSRSEFQRGTFLEPGVVEDYRFLRSDGRIVAYP
jgi:hypothetical protein